MSLEDHLGDIVRKGRKATSISLETAAQAGGVPPAALEQFEEDGQRPAQLQMDGLARALQLDPRKLESVGSGWLPKQPDLTTWRELRVITTTRNGMAVNCYLVWDEVSREAALFDTGWEAEPIEKLIEENQLTLKHIFLTHTHEDHVAALEPIRTKYPKAIFHTSSKAAPPQHRNRANDFIHLGNLRITNREATGHAEDGVIYIVGNWPEDAGHVGIIGDTIFAGSIATGFISWDTLKERIREAIFTLPPETLLCSGHGPLTTVGEEKEHNPFF